MIGIFGGTFDPVHYGHLRAAVEVKERLGLDQVRMIPCAQPSHRKMPFASAAQRLSMLQLAISGHPGLVADNREIVRGGVSYMIDTLVSLREDYPRQPLLLFIGADASNHLPTWKQWQDLFAFAHVIVMTRPGYGNPRLCSFLSAKLVQSHLPLSENLAGRLYFQAITPLDIAATTIRRVLADQHNPAFLLPDTPTLTLSAKQLVRDAAILNAVKTPYDLKIHGELAANVAQDSQNGHITALSIVDTAAHISSQLNTLQSNVSKLSGITLTNKAIPTLSLSAAQLESSLAVLNLITSPYLLSVKDTAANINNLVLPSTNGNGIEIMPTSLMETLVVTRQVTDLNLSQIKLVGYSITEKVYQNSGTEVDIIARNGTIVHQLLFTDTTESQLHLLGIGNTVVNIL